MGIPISGTPYPILKHNIFFAERGGVETNKKYTMGFDWPKTNDVQNQIWVPQNGWFIMENPKIKWMI